MGILIYIPLLGIIVIGYNILAFAGVGMGWGEMDTLLNSQILTVPMVKGSWPLRFSDLVLAISLILLFLEILRSTSIKRAALVNHALSMGVFILALVEFLILTEFATSTFFLVMLMTLMDVIGGFTIGVVAARRDIGIGGSVIDHS